MTVLSRIGWSTLTLICGLQEPRQFKAIRAGQVSPEFT
jgi:hypothetical protein